MLPTFFGQDAFQRGCKCTTRESDGHFQIITLPCHTFSPRFKGTTLCLGAHVYLSISTPQNVSRAGNAEAAWPLVANGPLEVLPECLTGNKQQRPEGSQLCLLCLIVGRLAEAAPEPVRAHHGISCTQQKAGTYLRVRNPENSIDDMLVGVGLLESARRVGDAQDRNNRQSHDDGTPPGG